MPFLSRRFVPLLSLLALAMLIATVFVRAQNIIPDGSFDEGKDGFWASGGVELSRSNGTICARIPAGGAAWDRLIGVNDIAVEAGTRYRLTLTMTGKNAFPISIVVQSDKEPWTAQAQFEAPSAGGSRALQFDMRAKVTEQAQIVFHLGGAPEAWELCIANISFEKRVKGDRPQPRDAGAAMVNQAGYLTNGPKRATIMTPSDKPLAFKILDAKGATVGAGTTVQTGYDPTVDAATQVADFSALNRAGKGYRLLVQGLTSQPFAIGDDVYGRLRVDALSWFYPQRSGVEIRGDIAGSVYARPAGHIGVSPNRGDLDVGCLTGDVARALYGDWRCAYRLNVSGGWYDAGDHGKYVVNGAIAAAQLLGAYERARTFGPAGSPILTDGFSRIPEHGNGVPDILDETRAELDFLLKMVVPAGQKFAGMAHHKVHDTHWTDLPMLPHLDPQERALHRPSTAATLDLAAVTAQGARLFAPYDAAYAARLLSAAKAAWTAAAANPALYAPVSDGKQGGGDYPDDDVTDETYWAAAELLITTGDPRYLSALKASPHWEGDVFAASGAFDWRDVAGLARLDLALYGKPLGADDRRLVQDSVRKAGEDFLALQATEPFGQIYRPQDDLYGWGSNQAILQNMLVMAAAYDLGGDRALLGGVQESMDYILGRNAMNMSYVTGYGTVFSKNQHSRWYARQLDARLPGPPVGTLAGGPNSTLVDDVAKAKLVHCAPQTCYIDDIYAWGTNEMAINWNAPLVAVASFLADAH